MQCFSCFSQALNSGLKGLLLVLLTIDIISCDDTNQSIPQSNIDQKILNQQLDFKTNMSDQLIQDQLIQDQLIQDQLIQDQALAVEESLVLWDKSRITSDSNAPNFQNISAQLAWGQAPLSQAILVMDLESSCFPFEKWRDDPPPMGQNWPPLCDAFDRNYEITLHQPNANADDIGIELIRAITPFGGPLHLEVDITDILNGLQTPMVIKAHITTYADGNGQVSGSQGGWFVSGKIQLKRGTAPRQVLGVIPLYNDWYPQSLNRESRSFNLPAGTQKAIIEYRATGHGGGNDPSTSCIGPAEEFCRRVHELKIDQQTEQWLAWRDDCDLGCRLTNSNAFTEPIQYCEQNPMGDINSVKAPRANWCPGSITPPKLLTIPIENPQNLSHQFGFSVLNAYQERGWRISAVVIAYGE